MDMAILNPRIYHNNKLCICRTKSSAVDPNYHIEQFGRSSILTIFLNYLFQSSPQTFHSIPLEFQLCSSLSSILVHKCSLFNSPLT